MAKVATVSGRSKRHRSYVAALKANGTYDRLVEAHGAEECWICGRAPGKRRLSIDHDHKGMFPRGLLCFRCNRILEESITPELLDAMSAYLRAARARWDEMIAGKRLGGEEGPGTPALDQQNEGAT
jgi:hypothetical protein